VTKINIEKQKCLAKWQPCHELVVNGPDVVIYFKYNECVCTRSDEINMGRIALGRYNYCFPEIGLLYVETVARLCGVFCTLLEPPLSRVGHDIDLSTSVRFAVHCSHRPLRLAAPTEIWCNYWPGVA
jgi:hypothetical protein